MYNFTNPASSCPLPAQAPGRLLTYADLNIGLVGRHAEMYWPDDNLWYLIKIQVRLCLAALSCSVNEPCSPELRCD